MAKIEQTIEVNAPVQAAYSQLTRFEQYPRFIDDLKEVRQIDDTHLHWHTRAGNLDMEWDAEITQQIPDRCIAWRTTSGPRYEGRIELVPAAKDRTRVSVTMECDARHQVLAQHGNVEDVIAQRAGHDLSRFKKFIEKLVQQGGEQERDVKESATESGADRTSGQLVGKAIGQTEEEQQEAAQSGEPAHRGQDSGRAGGQEGGRQGRQSVQDAAPAHAGGDMQSRLPWLPGLLQAWNEPFGLMRKMSEDMDQLLHNYISRPLNDARLRTGSTTGWTPPVEVAQREGKFVVCAELPGVRREDVQVEIQRDRLTIEGDRHQEPMHESNEYRRSERCYGHFYRAIALPPGADTEAASALLHDGVLEVTVPVRGNAKQGRRLDIRVPHA